MMMKSNLNGCDQGLMKINQKAGIGEIHKSQFFEAVKSTCNMQPPSSLIQKPHSIRVKKFATDWEDESQKLLTLLL